MSDNWQDRTYFTVEIDPCSEKYRIFDVGFSGKSVSDKRIWGRNQRAEAEAALVEFERAVELHEAFCPGCRNTTTRKAPADLSKRVKELEAQLAAAKARERELREALRNACGWHDLLSPNPCPSGCRWTDEDPSRYVHVAACSAQSTGEAATSPRGRGDGRGAMNCPKAPHHENSGYLHDPDDDRPYYVDGLWYCGRCHYFLESNMTCARSSSLPAEHEGRAE